MKPRIAVIGAGPAGLFAAETAATLGADVVMYDAMRLPGRKFLLAGRGGLNLTHSDPLELFLTRYREGGGEMAAFVRAFPAEALRDWADGLGAETFVGSSKRVFPRAMKASPLLRAWLQRLADLGATFVAGARFVGIDQGRAWIAQDGVSKPIEAEAVVLALGGASWPELGSDGAWTKMFADDEIAPLQPSNAGVRIAWPEAIRAIAGQPLKMISVIIGEQRFKGEAILTEYGLEGGAIYQANAAIRAELQVGRREIQLDFQPNLSADVVAERAKRRATRRTLTAWLEHNLGLSHASARIVAVGASDRSPAGLTQAVKGLALKIEGMAPMARAISSAGGMRWTALNPDLSLRRAPCIFIAGEMLDWDAPTGGYLLQGCFATGRAAGLGALAYARARLSEA